MAVKWSAYSPSTPTIQDQILKKSTECSICEMMLEKNENKQLDGRGLPYD